MQQSSFFADMHHFRGNRPYTAFWLDKQSDTAFWLDKQSDTAFWLDKQSDTAFRFYRVPLAQHEKELDNSDQVFQDWSLTMDKGCDFLSEKEEVLLHVWTLPI